MGLKQWPGGQQEWDKVITNLLRFALTATIACKAFLTSYITIPGEGGVGGEEGGADEDLRPNL